MALCIYSVWLDFENVTNERELAGAGLSELKDWYLYKSPENIPTFFKRKIIIIIIDFLKTEGAFKCSITFAADFNIGGINS